MKRKVRSSLAVVLAGFALIALALGVKDFADPVDRTGVAGHAQMQQQGGYTYQYQGAAPDRGDAS